jgi:predicted metal-binding membrane protein
MMTATSDAPRLLMLWAMWAAMMAGMMLPTITPCCCSAHAMRNRADGTHATSRIYAMAAGT